MTAAPWVGTEDLPAGVPQLLEASAGTGKTWQIAGLVVRLVAEYAIPLDRVLVITFTSAATAELRDRIRRRLLASRELLRGDREAGDDPILDTLAADDRVRPERLARVEAALSAFDLAPISTIHGFCQRMLEQLAFESGQEPTLELLTDLGPLLDELVWDELALAFASTRAEDLPLLEDLGWTSERLGAIARAMAAAASNKSSCSYFLPRRASSITVMLNILLYSACRLSDISAARSGFSAAADGRDEGGYSQSSCEAGGERGGGSVSMSLSATAGE